MSNTVALIKELDLALTGAPNERRLDVLRQVTDLFTERPHAHSDAEMHLFDDVLEHLVCHVESRALVEISRRLAPLSDAPARTIKQLARHDEIAVSGPVLRQSPRLSDADLIEIAKTKSQAHLTHIAGRAGLNEAVSDVLIDRGDAEVANTVAGNAEAKLSRLGLAKLAMRAEGDDRLTDTMLRRADLPRTVFRELMLQATEIVRERMLSSAAPAQQALIQQVLSEMSRQMAGGRRPQTANPDEVNRAIRALEADGGNLRLRIAEFATARQPVKMVAALSMVSGVPAAQVDGLLQAPADLGLLALCRSVMLDWRTTSAVMMARPRHDETPGRMFDLEEQFNSLSPPSAQQLILFWQSRKASGAAHMAA